MKRTRILTNFDIDSYTEQQKKRLFFIFGIVCKLGFKYWSNDLQDINNAWNMCILNASQMDSSFE